MNTVVRIAGVPEHFNLPWLMALEEGAFSARGIDLRWTDVPEGTGKMAQMLREGQTDLAVILTEGLVKAVTEGTPVQIAQEYIASPLHWGIHVHQSSPFQKESELEGKTAAISRYGSGSHLMAFIHAQNQGWPVENLDFEVVNTLEGAVAALASGAADYFMWERFTTQPLVDQGVFRRVGVCPTPWPCFVISCTEEFGRKSPGVLSDLLEIINTFTVEFREIPSIDRTLALRYGQTVEGIREWLALTRWSQTQIKEEDLENVIRTLNHLNLISNNISVEALMWKP
jgi:ABC-type nitrate/sulfonate/bicarbonate transport system substrate-binding protein